MGVSPMHSVTKGMAGTAMLRTISQRQGRRMGRRTHAAVWAGMLTVLTLSFAGCAGCSSHPFEPAAAAPMHGPVVRVRLLGAQDQVLVKATDRPLISSSSEPQPRAFNFPPD